MAEGGTSAFKGAQLPCALDCRGRCQYYCRPDSIDQNFCPYLYHGTHTHIHRPPAIVSHVQCTMHQRSFLLLTLGYRKPSALVVPRESSVAWGDPDTGFSSPVGDFGTTTGHGRAFCPASGQCNRSDQGEGFHRRYQRGLSIGRSK